jgi:glutaredoxin 3
MAVQMIKIFTKKYCPFCTFAKQLLQHEGVPATAIIEIDIESNITARDEMIALTNRRTVPQIFIGTRYIGGYDDLQACKSNGELTLLLATYQLKG